MKTLKWSKRDLTREFKTYYTAETTPKIGGQVLDHRGKGSLGGGEFQARVGALYSLAYGVKALMKREGGDFTVAKLEGLWWVDSDKPFTEVPRQEWRWKLLIRQPEFVTPEVVERARDAVIREKGGRIGKGG
jgi:hypothetical protein